MVQTIDMPGVLANDCVHDASVMSVSYHGSPPVQAKRLSSDLHRWTSSEMSTPVVDGVPGGWPLTPSALSNGSVKEGIGGKDGCVLSVPNGSGERAPSAKSVALSTRTRRSSGMDSEKKSGEVVKEDTRRPGAAEEGYFTTIPNGKPDGLPKAPLPRQAGSGNADALPSTPNRTISATIPATSSYPLAPVKESSPALPSQQASSDGMLKPPSAHPHRASSPPAFSPGEALTVTKSRPDRLVQRHTLEVPKVVTSHVSADGRDAASFGTDGVVLATGRFSPSTPTRRRGSLQLARRMTRSIHSYSDMQLDQVPQDEDAARWTELVKAKRASKRQRADTDDDRVVIGKKVEEGHQNYIRMYNMLTGIRFCVSRIHAKMDRELTDADFRQAQKYSFDITGSELTPSAKYDFKFKDYAPWVFRHIRTAFGIDPAEYLVSLTAKYILSELGSPGKSGSFFYFSRDYKYIIKTIHHAEHKFLRMILKDYYHHILANPNTLLSQFYGLHRVKLPYGKKIHFIVMNNLFPPHRDIHRTFDLKGSTIGRDFREEDLEKNPRATLKDLNWLRRNLHLEFGPIKKDAFVAQMEKDVAFLQRLKIMDYSLLVGIHDLGRGNEENLRDKTLQVFQPGGDKGDDPLPGSLTRTPSKMENAKRARELRETVKKERPIPLGQTMDKMPEEPHRKGFYFYADDGGFQATHEDNSPGEEIYYLGIIDCLTKYNLVKKAEHFWKGMGGHESQISPIPPERYGDRFIKFISGITMSREEAELVHLSDGLEATAGMRHSLGIEGTIDDPRLGGINIRRDPLNPPGTANVMARAELEAEKSKRHGANEDDVPDRTRATARTAGDSNDAATLPVIGEAAESASNASRSPSKRSPAPSRDDGVSKKPVLGNANMPSEILGEVPPPTPPKLLDDGTKERNEHELSARHGSWGGAAPPTPPKDYRRGRLIDKRLPDSPIPTALFSASPSRAAEEELERARAKVGL